MSLFYDRTSKLNKSFIVINIKMKCVFKVAHKVLYNHFVNSSDISQDLYLKEPIGGGH